MSSSSVAVKAGDTLEGRYRIIKTVGEGGMGTVYLAEHMLIKRKVAIKILRAELATDTQVVERFMNEAKAAGAIGHPHIVESTDMGFTRDEVPFIVFEYLEGTLLTDEIYRVRGLPPRRALRIATQIASALHAAHSAGIIHRDLKSDNIFLTDREEASDHVKVLDFGISRFLEAEQSEDSSGRHQVMGTPEFMAPEQILTPDKVDRRADIYALGVVLFEMLAARRPFDFDEPDRTTRRRLTETDKLLHKIVTEPVPGIGRFDLPPGLEELLREKLLSKDPDDRFQSMKDVQAAFEAFTAVSRRDSEPIPIATSQLASTPTPMPAEPARKSRVGWLFAAVLFAAAGAASFLMAPQLTGSNNDASKKAIESGAEKLASTLDSQAQSAHMRADGISTSPMLRAAIETDAATLADMVKDKDVLFKPHDGEVLEVFQVHDGKSNTMLRIPDTARALRPLSGNETRIETDGKQLIMVVGSAVTTQQGATGGVLALAAPVDLGQVKQALEQHAKSATLIGLERPVVLTGASSATGDRLVLPVKLSPQTKTGGLSLAAVVEPAAVTEQASTFEYARYACFGLAGFLFLIFVVRSRR